MTNVANLNATLSLSAFEFNNNLKHSETAMMEFAMTTEMQSRRADEAFGRVGSSIARKGSMAQVATNVGYMIQDFSSQLNNGVGRALGAVTNNIQMLGPQLGLSAGKSAALAVGAAIGGVVVPAMIDWLSNTKQMNEELDLSIEKYEKLATQARALATMSVKGGIDESRKALEETVEIADRQRQEMGQALMREMNELSKRRKDWEAISSINKVSQAMELAGMGNRAFNPLNIENWHVKAQFDQQAALVKRMEVMHAKVMAEAQQARELLRKSEPGATPAIDNKRSEQQARYEEELTRKQYKWREEAEAGIAKKYAETYGSEVMKAEKRIALERFELTRRDVSKETQAKFEAMSKLDRKRAEMADIEKRIAENQTHGHSSDGVRRDSVEGVRAINAAVAGTKSAQSIAHQQLEVAKKELIALEKIARGEKPGATPKNGTDKRAEEFAKAVGDNLVAGAKAGVQIQAKGADQISKKAKSQMDESRKKLIARGEKPGEQHPLPKAAEQMKAIESASAKQVAAVNKSAEAQKRYAADRLRAFQAKPGAPPIAPEWAARFAQQRKDAAQYLAEQRAASTRRLRGSAYDQRVEQSMRRNQVEQANAKKGKPDDNKIAQDQLKELQKLNSKPPIKIRMVQLGT